MGKLVLLAAAMAGMLVCTPACAGVELQLSGVMSGSIGSFGFTSAPVAFYIYLDDDSFDLALAGDANILKTGPNILTFYVDAPGTPGFATFDEYAGFELYRGRGNASFLRLGLVDGPTLLELSGADFDHYDFGGDFATLPQAPTLVATDVAFATDFGPLVFAADPSSSLNLSSSFGTPSTIPEPGNWVLLVAGFGMMGVALRRTAVCGFNQ